MDAPNAIEHIFGPVPSRRLGRSLGVSAVPRQTCSYSCVYCQLGRTSRMTVSPRAWYDLDSILEGVARKNAQLRSLGEAIDYVTFVADGEPTLDANLEAEAEILGSVGFQTAIITNGSLLERAEVRQALRHFHWVSIKVDTVDPRVWRQVNRPHGSLALPPILDAIAAFAESYAGILCTETMLIEGLNDGEPALRDLAAFLEPLRPRTSYLSIPLRPPAEAWVLPPSEPIVARAYAILSRRLGRVECLTTPEGDSFSLTGEPEEDLLAITAVHPMRERAVRKLLGRSGASWARVDALLATGQLVEVRHQGETFYLRRHSRPRSPTAGSAPVEAKRSDLLLGDLS